MYGYCYHYLVLHNIYILCRTIRVYATNTNSGIYLLVFS